LSIADAEPQADQDTATLPPAGPPAPVPTLALEAGPVTEPERIDSLDVLRGVAILGILVMNIQSFAMIGVAYDNPAAYGDFSRTDYWVWFFAHVLFSQKFMTIFTMLFGAGVVLMCGRREARGQGSAGVHYRRMVVLLIIGLLHAYLLWHGDILNTYALCGLIVYLCRKWRPSVLIGAGLPLMVIPCLISLALAWSMRFWPSGEVERFVLKAMPTVEKIDLETTIFSGGWWGQMGRRGLLALMIQTFGFFLGTLWLCTGLMMIGMALFKLGVFSARRSARFYGIMTIGGLLVGLPIILFGVHENIEVGWHAKFRTFIGSQFNYLAALPVALGWVGLVMLMCRLERLRGVTRPFAAAGRMAFTNYLMQTVLCTMLFYGHGLGLFGRVSRLGQLGVVAGVWLVQLIISMLWLRRFRFGPAEWLWRSLTYWKRQPLLRR
jgi:uncharacterized protein